MMMTMKILGTLLCYWQVEPALEHTAPLGIYARWSGRSSGCSWIRFGLLKYATKSPGSKVVVGQFSTSWNFALHARALLDNGYRLAKPTSARCFLLWHVSGRHTIERRICEVRGQLAARVHTFVAALVRASKATPMTDHLAYMDQGRLSGGSPGVCSGGTQWVGSDDFSWLLQQVLQKVLAQTRVNDVKTQGPVVLVLDMTRHEQYTSL